MQKQVGQQRTDDTTLWRALRSLLQRALLPLHGGTKPPRYVQLDPLAVSVMGHSTFDQIMPERIKESFDVQIDDPA